MRFRCLQLMLGSRSPREPILETGGVSTVTQSTDARILVADDDETLCQALIRYLSSLGYDVSTANSGSSVLERLQATKVSLLILDLAMPGMSGVDVVPKALELDPELTVIMLSGVNDALTAAKCMQLGATDYLTKPIELTELASAIRRSLRQRDTLQQGRAIESWLREELARRGQEIEHERQQQQSITIATLEALINALEAKSGYFRGHSARVSALAATISHELGLSDEVVEDIRRAGKLHDVGMIGIREDILNKRGPLSDEEREHVKQHVLIAWRILEPLTHLGSVVSFVRFHHEHWDGSGYPAGIKGEQIPIGARVICAAEVYDALTTSRPYHEKMSPEDATACVSEMAGSLLDPNVTRSLANAVARRKTLVFIDDDHLPLVEQKLASKEARLTPGHATQLTIERHHDMKKRR